MLKRHCLLVGLVGMSAGLGLLVLAYALSLWWLALPVVSILLYLGWGVTSLSAGIFIPALVRGQTHEKWLALTFDDGPHPQHTLDVLAVLAQHQVPATFFCIGKYAEQYPDVVRQVEAAGHLIGNHSYSHNPWLPFRSVQVVAHDYQQAQWVLSGVLQRPPAFVRPPYGITNPTVGRALRRLGLPVIGWHIRSYDTLMRSPEAVARRVVRRLRPGAVILLHDRLPLAAAALQILIREAHTAGWRFVALPDLFPGIDAPSHS